MSQRRRFDFGVNQPPALLLQNYDAPFQKILPNPSSYYLGSFGIRLFPAIIAPYSHSNRDYNLRLASIRFRSFGSLHSQLVALLGVSVKRFPSMQHCQTRRSFVPRVSAQ